jgi:hypothetical protein
MIKSRRIRRARRVARMGHRRGPNRALVGKLEGKRQLKDPRGDGRIILEWIFKK